MLGSAIEPSAQLIVDANPDALLLASRVKLVIEDKLKEKWIPAVKVADTLRPIAMSATILH